MNANSLFRRCFPCRRLPRLLRSLISECPQQEWNLGLSGYRLVQLLYHWATGDSWKLLKAIKLDWFDKHFGLLLVSQSGSVREGTSERRSREGTRPPPPPNPLRSRVSSRVSLARVHFTISPKWRACSQAIKVPSSVYPPTHTFLGLCHAFVGEDCMTNRKNVFEGGYLEQ